MSGSMGGQKTLLLVAGNPELAPSEEDAVLSVLHECPTALLPLRDALQVNARTRQPRSVAGSFTSAGGGNNRAAIATKGTAWESSRSLFWV